MTTAITIDMKAAVSASPGDFMTRMVYSDALLDDGQEEEALRQRLIAEGWPLMGDFKPFDCPSSTFDVWN